MSKKRLKELEDLTAELQESLDRERRMSQSLYSLIKKLELGLKKLEKTIIKLALDD